MKEAESRPVRNREKRDTERERDRERERKIDSITEKEREKQRKKDRCSRKNSLGGSDFIRVPDLVNTGQVCQ